MSLSRFLFLVAVALAIGLPVRYWVIEPIYIASESMEPALPTGTHAWMDRITLRLRRPKRNDIVVFASPVGDDFESVKRVIAVAGETVELREKKVFINGVELGENYVRHLRPDDRYPGDNVPPLTVPNGTIFVLGDNRDVSKDSATWTDPATKERVHLLPLKNVKGLVRGFY